MDKKYFSQRPELKPIIYVYEIPDAENRKGLLKIGYTTRNAKGRIKEQLGTAGLNYNILLEQEAIRSDGSTFDDHEIHRYLRKKDFANPLLNPPIPQKRSTTLSPFDFICYSPFFPS